MKKHKKKLVLLLVLLLMVASVVWFEHQDKRHYERPSVFYAIKTSNSMGWSMGQFNAVLRLNHAKEELKKNVLALSEDARFNILSFDCAAYPWERKLVPATRANKALAIKWIDGLHPDYAGGDAPGVVAALSMDRTNRHVVLFTDCRPNCGAGDQSGSEACYDAHRQKIQEANTQGAVIDVLAFGAGDNGRRVFMRLAADNRGTYLDVP